MHLNHRRPAAIALSAIVLGFALATGSAGAQGTAARAVDPITAEGYIAPPENIARLVTAPRETNALLGTPSPVSRRWFLRTINEGMPLLEYVGKPFNNLAGWQVDPAGNRARALTMRSNQAYEVFDWAANKTTRIDPPAGARAGGATSWSPEGARLAYFALFPDATHIYIADPATGRSTPLTRTSVLATNVTNIEWTADGRSIITVLAPDGRGPEPKAPPVATTPLVRVNENKVLKSRTHFDLLQTPYEKELVRYHATGQLALIDVRTRAVKKVGAPGMIRSINPSPDGTHFRVTYVDEPFSYLLPVANFGTTEVIVDQNGTILQTLVKRPVNEGAAIDDDAPPAPAGGGRGGLGANADSVKRNLAWHPFQPGMMFMRSAAKDSVTRARDDSLAAARAARAAAAGGRGGAAPAFAAGAGGRGAQPDSAPRATRPDTLFHWKAPFTGEASFAPLYVTPAPGTIGNVQFDETGRIMFVTQTVGGATTTDAIFLDENNAKFTVTRGGGGGAAGGGRGGAGGGGRGGAAGGGAGGLETAPGSRGVTVVMTSTDGKHVFRRGTSPDSTRGPRPYVEKIDIRTGTATKVYESTLTDLTESIGAPLDRDFSKFLVTRQSAKQPPQQFIVDAATKQATLVRQATDLMPEITNAIRKDVFAKRADGYTFRIRVTLPADYKEGSNPRYPAMFWFYPREYNDQAAYDASLGGGGRGNSNGPGTFPGTPGVRSMAFLTAAGYAVIEPDAPIFASEGRLPNDNYVVDLRNDLAATIDALDTLGIIDRHRLGIGGHSYGAFSAVNAMVHTPYFKAGIAGDGAYNRTLTPNGFQTERRDFWQARDTYLAMSPFLYANQLNGALLLYHSTDDQNVGTHPINSERLYHALMGQGKNVSLYMYPYEDHGPIARETVLDQWARWVAWLDKYVKNANQSKVTAQ